MSERSAIEWTTATWNPWRGCDKVSPGCAHCYMFRDQLRYGRDPSAVIRASEATFYAPLRAKKWKELPAGSMVFTCSWSDFFHEDADEWRADAWHVIAWRPDLVWQILTKRPERIVECLPPDWGDGWDNVWLGTSIENRRFVQRADALREVPAQVRFISAEPLLGPLVHDFPLGELDGEGDVWRDGYGGPELDLDGIDWLIVGGESGKGARRLDLDWMRALRDHCEHFGTAFFVKQLGGARPGNRLEDLPEDLRIREYPTTRTEAVA